MHQRPALNFAAVEYLGKMYYACELRSGYWYFTDCLGVCHPFFLQERVHVLSPEQGHGHNAETSIGSLSGHC